MVCPGESLIGPDDLYLSFTLGSNSQGNNRISDVSSETRPISPPGLNSDYFPSQNHFTNPEANLAN
jgi:hypothetical protein